VVDIKSLNWVSFWECTFCVVLHHHTPPHNFPLQWRFMLPSHSYIHCSIVHLTWYLKAKNESRKPFRWIIKHIPIIHFSLDLAGEFLFLFGSLELESLMQFAMNYTMTTDMSSRANGAIEGQPIMPTRGDTACQAISRALLQPYLWVERQFKTNYCCV
jgi:hypothetical protein